MSFFIDLAKKLDINSADFSDFVNKSYIAKMYARISVYLNKMTENSTVIAKLDDIYYVALIVLFFAIPFVNTGMIGILSSILIIISLAGSILKHRKFTFSRLHFPIMVYLFILMISVGFSSLFLPSLKGFLKMIIYFGAFFSFFEYFKRYPKRIMPAICILAFSCCIEMLFSLKQMIFGVEELASWQDKTATNPEDMLNRIFGTLKPYNPNLFAAYILAAAPSVFILTLNCIIKKQPKLATVFGFFSILSLVTIVQTGCRGAYLGLFAAGILAVVLFFITFKEYFKKYNYKKILIFTFSLILLLILLVIIASPSILHRLTSIFTFRGDSSNSYRMNVYIASLKMFFDNFWTGIGTGNTTYRLIYGLYMVTGFDALGAYNIYLEMGVESGIFAILTFLWIIFATFKNALRYIMRFSDLDKLIIVMLLVAIAGMLIHGFFDTVWYRPQLQILFWFYMAILAVYILKGENNEQF